MRQEIRNRNKSTMKSLMPLHGEKKKINQCHASLVNQLVNVTFAQLASQSVGQLANAVSKLSIVS